MSAVRIFFIFFFFLISSSFFPPSVAHAGTCDYPKFCNTLPRPTTNTNDPQPGQDCTIPGVTDTSPNIHYQYASGTCVFQSGTCGVRCGFLGTGFCCEPKSGSKNADNPATVTQAPPCGNDIKKDGKCTTVNTALGPIQTDVAGLVQNIFVILLGLSGGTALLLIIAAGYQMMMSQGNPEKVKEGRERLTAAIVGLVFIIFSTAILQLIGIDILHLPGFSR